jgi:membrane peptidoglycan carboxypeptidase
MEFGVGSDLTLPDRTVAAKTGTTNDFRDNLTVGFTPHLVTAVWVGNADNSPMINSTGITGAAPIWHRFMDAALAATPDEWYDTPSDVEPSGGSYFLLGTRLGGYFYSFSPEPGESPFPYPFLSPTPAVSPEPVATPGNAPPSPLASPSVAAVSPSPTSAPSAAPSPSPAASPTSGSTPQPSPTH